MYLSKKQEAALDLALDAIDGFRSGEKTAEEQEAFETIIQMLDSTRKERVRRSEQRRRKHDRS